jgi:hypothetical protein
MAVFVLSPLNELECILCVCACVHKKHTPQYACTGADECSVFVYHLSFFSQNVRGI